MCLSILACLFPPIAVCFKKGLGCDCCINILLTILGYFPGCCHACYVIHQEKKRGGVTQITTIQMAAPVTSPPQHIVVNVNERQGQSGSGGSYGHPYPMPTPAGGPHSPPYPMATPQNLYPTPIQSPPPAYNFASAPQYSGQGDYIPPK